MSHIRKDEYFSCGCNESIHNIVTLPQMTEGKGESGRVLWLPLVVIRGAGSLRDGGMNLRHCSYENRLNRIPYWLSMSQ